MGIPNTLVDAPLQTFCSIYTSPTSSESFDMETDDGPSRKQHKTDGQKKATKSSVATLLRMENKVTPRSIAYAATLVSMLPFPPFTSQVHPVSWSLI